MRSGGMNEAENSSPLNMLLGWFIISLLGVVQVSARTCSAGGVCADCAGGTCSCSGPNPIDYTRSVCGKTPSLMCFRFLHMNTPATAIKATAATDPITMPAIAPPLKPPEVDGALGAPVLAAAVDSDRVARVVAKHRAFAFGTHVGPGLVLGVVEHVPSSMASTTGTQNPAALHSSNANSPQLS